MKSASIVLEKYELEIHGWDVTLEGGWGYVPCAQVHIDGKRFDVKMSKKLTSLDLHVGDVLVGEARISTQFDNQIVAWKNVSVIRGEVRGKGMMDNDECAYYARCFGWAN